LDELSRKADLYSNDAEMMNSTLKDSQTRSKELQSRLAHMDSQNQALTVSIILLVAFYLL